MRINGENESEKQSEERSEQTKALDEARDCGGARTAARRAGRAGVARKKNTSGVTRANHVLFRAGQ